MASQTSFTPKDFSLRLDHIEQHGRYLFVASREKVTTVPETIDQVSDGVAKPETNGHSEQAKSSNNDITSPKTETTPTVTNSDTAKPSLNASDPSDEASSEAPSDSATEDEGLSAYESWSEASTEYSEDEILAELAPRPVVSSNKVPVITEQHDDTATDISSFSDDDLASTSSSSSSSSSDAEPSTTRHNATEMDENEDNRMFDAIFTNDRDGPVSDSDPDNGDYPPDEAFEDNGYALFGDDEDFDGFQAVESDSEDCEECGDDGGACALPSADNAAETGSKAEAPGEHTEMPLGMPMAQIHVYDTEACDEDGTPRTIFRYTTPTMSPPLINSPPAIHPTKSLVVYPLDNKLLFADYIENTYFARKIRVRRMFSSHVSITPAFSRDGRYLHVAVVEKQDRPPLRPRKTRAVKGQVQKGQIAKKEQSKYELVVSTYRLSRAKTSRAPPILVHRDLVDLGSSRERPICRWYGEELFVPCVRGGGELELELEVYSLGVSTPEGNSNRQRSRAGTIRTASAVVQRCFFQLPGWVATHRVEYMPGDGTESRGGILVAYTPQYTGLVGGRNAGAQGMSSKPVSGQSPVGDIQNIESEQAGEPGTIVSGLNARDVKHTEGSSGGAMPDSPAQSAVMVAFLAEGEVGAYGVSENGKEGEVIDLKGEARWVRVCD